MVCAGSGDRRDRRAQPRPCGRARARPDGRSAHCGARLRLFRSAFRANRDGSTPCRRLSPCMRSASWIDFLVLYSRAAYPRHSLPARAGAICSSARPPCRSPGRRRDSAPARGPCLPMERARGRGPRHRLTLGPLSAPGPLQVFVGPPDASPMTSLPWLVIPGFLVPILLFTHVVIFRGCTRGPKSRSRRMRGSATASQNRPEKKNAGAWGPGVGRRSFWRPGEP